MLRFKKQDLLWPGHLPTALQTRRLLRWRPLELTVTGWTVEAVDEDFCYIYWKKTPQGSENSSVLPDPLATVVMQQEGTVGEREAGVTSLPLQYAPSSGDWCEKEKGVERGWSLWVIGLQPR